MLIASQQAYYIATGHANDHIVTKEANNKNTTGDVGAIDLSGGQLRNKGLHALVIESLLHFSIPAELTSRAARAIFFRKMVTDAILVI